MIPPRLRLAAASALGHPFVLVSLAVLLAGRRTLPPAQLTILLGAVAAALVLQTIYIGYRVRTGRWTDFDVSVRAQRPRLFLSAMLLSRLALLVLWQRGLPAEVLRGIGAALGLLAAAMLGNFLLKVSLHVAFDVYAALLAGWAGGGATALLLGAAALVGWSRVALGRHSRAEVLAGALLGTLAGAAAGPTGF